MRVCPRCAKEYGDNVAFCFADGVPTREVETPPEEPPEAAAEPVEDAAPEPVDEPAVEEPPDDREVLPPVRSQGDEDATDAPSLSEVSVDLQASIDHPTLEPEETAPVPGPADPGRPEAIDEEPVDQPLAQKVDDEEAFFDTPAEDLGGFDSDDDEPLEPAGKSNGLLIGMGLAALLMLGVGGWLLWQSFDSAEAVTEIEPVEVLEPLAEEPEEPVEEVEEPVEEVEEVEEVGATEPVEEPVDDEESTDEPEEEAPAAEQTEPVAAQPDAAAKKTSSGGAAKKTSTTSTSKKSTGLPDKPDSKVGRAAKKGAKQAPPADEDPWGEPDTTAGEAKESTPEADGTTGGNGGNGGSVGKAKKKKEQPPPAEEENPWGDIE